MNRLGIIAALRSELQPLVRNWRPLPLRSDTKGDAAWLGQIGPTRCFAVVAGMGQNAAARACSLAGSIAAEQGGLDGLVSIGWAGAISCGVFPGRPYWIAEAVDASTEERFPANVASSTGAPLVLVTSDRVAQPPEKRRLAERFHAVLVDMEAAAVARFARDCGLQFYCLKAVSDTATENLPDFTRYTDAYGKLRIGALLTGIALQPKYWRPMLRMGKNSKIGARALAAELERFLADTGKA